MLFIELSVQVVTKTDRNIIMRMNTVISRITLSFHRKVMLFIELSVQVVTKTDRNIIMRMNTEQKLISQCINTL